MNKVIYVILVIVLVGIIAVSGWNIYNTTTEYEDGDDTYDELQSFIQIPTAPPTEPPKETLPPETSPSAPTGTAEATETTEPEPTEPPDDTLWPVVDFAALKEINPDVVGWVYLEGTNINYPIVQADDNSYYLRRLYTGKKNHSGCIFMDYRCHSDLSSRHTVIYGHNMNNGAMFADLTKYRRQSFYDSHPVILILTPDGNYKVEIFSGYIDKSTGDAWLLDLNERNTEKWLNEVTEKSMFKTDVIPGKDDQIFTLSTCTYDYDHARLVIHGVLRP